MTLTKVFESSVPVYKGGRFQYLCDMILVTGATGLLGSRLVFDLTSGGKKVRALFRNEASKAHLSRYFKGYPELLQKIEFFRGDITDIFSLQEALAGVEEIYHCAGKVSFQPSDKEKMHHINISGTANIVNAALDAGIRKFCHVSSIAAIGRNGSSAMINEDNSWKTSVHNSEYAISKYGAEREVWRGIAEGLNAVIVNPGVIIGPGDWRTDSSMLFGQVQRGLRFYTEGMNGFVDVRDVSTSMIQLMNSGRTGERYILVAENKPFREVFDCIADQLHKPRPSIKAGPLLTSLAWRAEWIKSKLFGTKPVITRETARSASGVNRYDNSRIIAATGIQFIGIEKAIADAAAYFNKKD